MLSSNKTTHAPPRPAACFAEQATEECGVPPGRRFAFYDQIHTTGMDIKHVLHAEAVITLGKDMTFRDYAQVVVVLKRLAYVLPPSSASVHIDGLSQKKKCRK